MSHQKMETQNSQVSNQKMETQNSRVSSQEEGNTEFTGVKSKDGNTVFSFPRMSGVSTQTVSVVQTDTVGQGV